MGSRAPRGVLRHHRHAFTRGFYLELNVAIRTVEIAPDGSAVLGVGGGITADSDADAEWRECLHKAAATIGLTAIAELNPAL